MLCLTDKHGHLAEEEITQNTEIIGVQAGLVVVPPLEQMEETEETPVLTTNQTGLHLPKVDVAETELMLRLLQVLQYTVMEEMAAMEEAVLEEAAPEKAPALVMS